jgi:hypothetical protein
MPMADILINSASGNKVISFLDGYAGHNQIFMAEEDINKATFWCLGFVGLFEWVVMTFVLMNASATYQRAMNLIFHDLLGVLLVVYIDDVVVKLAGFEEHLVNLHVVFGGMRRYGLKMNLPEMCIWGICWEVLGVHCPWEWDTSRPQESRIHKEARRANVQERCTKAVWQGKLPKALRIKSSRKSGIVLTTCEAEAWRRIHLGADQRKAFERIKEYLSSAPVLRAPKVGEACKLYIAAQHSVMGTVLT